MKMKMFDTVRSVADVPERGVKAGDIGAIVEVYEDAYEVEFCNDDGETLVMFAMTETQVAPAHPLRQAA